MPIYEYKCKDCGTCFEDLVWGEADPPCPRCSSVQVAKLLSTFAVGAQAPTARESAASCGTCGDPRGPGACAMN